MELQSNHLTTHYEKEQWGKPRWEASRFGAKA